MKNWFGLEGHPTDSYIHWSVKDQVALAKKLRAVYDKIIAAGLKEELDILTGMAYDSGRDNEHENHIGSEL